MEVGLLTPTSAIISVSTITIGVTTHPVKYMSSGSESYCNTLLLCVFHFSQIILTLLSLYSNLNFAHSGEGDAQYADQSGMMGYSYSQDEGPVMVRKDGIIIPVTHSYLLSFAHVSQLCLFLAD